MQYMVTGLWSIIASYTNNLLVLSKIFWNSVFMNILIIINQNISRHDSEKGKDAHHCMAHLLLQCPWSLLDRTNVYNVCKDTVGLYPEIFL